MFPPPVFSTAPGHLTLGISEFLNFGFWQSPPAAIPSADGASLYAIRAMLSTGIAPCDVPTLRVRALAQGFAQSSLVSVNSTGDCSVAPGTLPRLFTSYMQPQGDAVGDAFIVAVDLLFFNPADASSGQIAIDHVDILRIPLSALGSPSSLRQYTFETSEEGWASGSAPSNFTPPDFEWTGSALSITSQNNLSTFGFWNNSPSDFSIEAGKLYRARFDWTATSNAPQTAQTATMRTRVFSSDNQLIQTTGHALANDGSGQFTAWFVPPPSLVGTGEDGLGLAFDLINFNPQAPAQVSLNVEQVQVDTFSAPAGFSAEPFVPEEDGTLPGGEYEFSDLIIPEGVEITVEGDVKFNVLGDVNIGGLLVADCARIEIIADGDITITGTVANTCSTTPTQDAKIIIQSNGGSLNLGTDGNPAEILSDSDVEITNAPDLEDWEFDVPEGGRSALPLPPVASAQADTLFDAATTTFTAEIQFFGFGADPDGGPVSYEWDFGDGGNSTERDPVHEYSAPGRRTVTLTVRDDEGETATATLTVVLATDAEGDTPTTPALQLDPYFIVVEQGSEALFVASSFDPDGQDVVYELDLGDSTVSNDEVTTHVYTAPGRYELTLKATDTSGTVSMATASVYVHPPLPAPPAALGHPGGGMQVFGNIRTEPIKPIGPMAPEVGRRQIPPPHPKAPVGKPGKNMRLRGRGNVVIPAGSVIKAGDGGDGANKAGQGYIKAGDGRVGGSTVILVDGDLTIAANSLIAAGNGGNGGRATATAPLNGNATARGGKGGPAGRLVWVQATRTLTFGPGLVFIDPGSGGNGGDAECFGTSGVVKCPRGDDGGHTWARGGNGGLASKVVIVRGKPVGLGNVRLTGGNGGHGAKGEAVSGTGGTAAVCNPTAIGGAGGNATAYGGRGGNAQLANAGLIGGVQPLSFQGGNGGLGIATGGDGGGAEAESDCALARARGGKGGTAVAHGGDGGKGFTSSGNGGNATANSGFGGNAKATGKLCGDNGGSAEATGGDGGAARAYRGRKGGSGAADGTVLASGGDGGDAEAVGADGKDKTDAPGGRGGNATAVGGLGGTATASRGLSIAGDGGDATATAGRGGHSTSAPPNPCESKTGLLGGVGGQATARGGNGGNAGGFQATKLDGFGGNATAAGGAGGDGTANGGHCDICGSKGGDAGATGGAGGKASAFKGKKGGSAAMDGTATARGGTGGSAFAVAGRGGDCMNGTLGGSGGTATATGGRGGDAAGNDTTNAGRGGNADSIGGQGGNSTNPPPDACQSQQALGGPGGQATSTAGNGGAAVSGTTRTDGDGGDAVSIGGNGGLADALGGNCTGCNAKGGNADSTAGNGGDASATKGKKGGPNAGDGAADARGGIGGNANAAGGKGGDCTTCPGGKGGPGGDVTGVGGNGGNAISDDQALGGRSGDILILGGKGGQGASCCVKPPLPGGDGGKGGDASATPGTPGTPGGSNGTVEISAGNGGNGGDGEGPGAGGAKGIGTNVPDGAPGNPGNTCPRTVITPDHSTLPPTITSNTPYTLTGRDSNNNTYSPIGCIFVAPEPSNPNQPSYLYDSEVGLVVMTPGSMDPNQVPARVEYDLKPLENVSTIGATFHAQTTDPGGFPANCIQVIGLIDGSPVNFGTNDPTTGQQVDVVLPPPPVQGTFYDSIAIVVYAIPVHFHHTTGVEIVDP
ncbi:MAG: hypothetical protein Kow0059_15090 [Candidatus Sumerlaeia bacterium]